MASFKLYDSSITATVGASAAISSSNNTQATVTVTVTGYIQQGYWVQSTGVVAEITVNGSTSTKTVFGNGNLYCKGPTKGEYAGRDDGVKSVTYAVYVDKGTSAKSVSWSVKFYTAIDGYTRDLKHTATGTVSIPAKPSYTIGYNANGTGVSNVPSSQTKWYGTAITVSAGPKRTGYTFSKWNTAANGSGTSYNAGASYTANANATLYAQWTANKYTVSYNANGGTGAPSSVQKTHGVNLTLSSTKPTRDNYTFLGWATSDSATAATYPAGAIYTANSSVTLYAVWQLAYTKPRIFNLQVFRCNSDGELIDNGDAVIVHYEWQTDIAKPTIVITWSPATDGVSSYTTDNNAGTSGTGGWLLEDWEFSPNTTYTFTVTVTDTNGSTSASTTVAGAKFPIDVKAGGDGVSFGKPAELGAAQSLGGSGVADFGYDAKFNEPVYGKALGMDRLPAIPANSELNDYIEPGCYAIYSNAIAGTVTSDGELLGSSANTLPPARAGRLEVWSATGEGVRLEQWSYLRQRFIPYNSANAVWERDVTRGENNVWNYGDWWRSSLTPAASQKVYRDEKAFATIALSSTTQPGVAGSYTPIPLNAYTIVSNKQRMTHSGNSVEIVSDEMTTVRVSGQVLVKCAGTTAERHVRIRLTKSSGETKDIAWICAVGMMNYNNVYPISPIICYVSKGDKIGMVFYTNNPSDIIAAGSSGNGPQTWLTVEEIR